MHQPSLHQQKPVRIEAMRFTTDTAEDVARWCDGVLGGTRRSARTRTPVLTIFGQIHGTIRAMPGDYVYRTRDGSFFVAGPAAFETQYEPVSTH
ncbi:hypothetical protein [Ruania alba]|uniref:Uncharacterized protein n=1 Tax=Ruania alba TaxID=648782 RepID=A0A1H5G9R5_9MICO|nr:hypothetical protein [Ruania alba]SEE12330.1 hypothetical protein SAMN04488554_1581 [Ruania alba]